MKLSRRIRLFSLTALLMLFTAAALTFEFVRHRTTWQYQQAQGEAEIAKGHYREAARHFVSAISLNAKNPDLYVLFGDALHGFRSLDVGFGGKDRAAWQRAISMDPSNLKAAHRLLLDSIERIDEEASVAAYQTLRDDAATVLKLDSNDFSSQKWFHIASIMIERSSGADDPELEVHSRALRALMRSHPRSADLPFYVAAVELDRAQRCSVAEQFDDTDVHLQTAADLFPRRANGFVGQSDLYIRAVAVFTAIARISSPQAARSLMDRGLFDARNVASMALAEPERAEEIVRAAVNAALVAQDEDAAITILTQQVRRDPSDLSMRLALSRLLVCDHRRLLDALEAVTVPREAQPDVASESVGRVSLECATLQTAISDTLTGTQRDFWLRQAAQYCDRAQRDGAEPRSVLKIRARILVSCGEFNSASQALASLPLAPSSEEDPELQTIRAGVLWASGRRAQALAHLEETLARRPAVLGVRLQLIDMLLELGRCSQAYAHVDELERSLQDAAGQESLEDLLDDTRWPILRDQHVALEACSNVLQRALSRDPENIQLRLTLIEVYALIRPLPQSQIQRLLDDADSTKTLSSSADWNHIRALLLLAQNRGQEAGLVLNRALVRAPSDSKLVYTGTLVQASRAFERGDRTSACAAIDTALCELSHVPATAQRRALSVARIIYQDTPRPVVSAQALTALCQFASQSPHDPDVLYILQRLADGRGDAAQAILLSRSAYVQMRREHRFDPDIIDACAWELVLDGQTEVGLRMLKTVVDNPAHQTWRCRVHYVTARLANDLEMVWRRTAQNLLLNRTRAQLDTASEGVRLAWSNWFRDQAGQLNLFAEQ